MQIDANDAVPITEVCRDFSKVERLVDKNGAAVILKDNAPRYAVIEYGLLEQLETLQDERLDAIAKKILGDNLETFRELAE